MRLDREWMYKRLDGKFLSLAFTKKVDEFVEYVSTQPGVVLDGLMKCPCMKCKNVPYIDTELIKVHLYERGFKPNYYRWIYHGEDNFRYPVEELVQREHASNPCMNMVIDAARSVYNEEIENDNDNHRFVPPQQKKFFEMLEAAQEPLYDGCNKSLLSVAAKITNIKCEHNICHKAIDSFTSLIKDICPDDNKMTDTFYRTRKLLEGLELPHLKIDVCPNGCMLFLKEYIDLIQCRLCKANRYKTMRKNGKHTAKKVLIHLPIGPRLQRLYATKSTATQMTCHAQNSRVGGEMSHPCDREAWKHINAIYPDFAAGSQNVRLGLCTDGFSPFRKSGKQYSCWPVILTPYNLPPHLCMKKPFMFLGLIITGPDSPKGNLDVFLEPLIDELKMLWNVGLPTYDVSKKETFQLRAMLHWTISDFPAYAKLSGWSTVGKFACPYCMQNRKSFTLVNGGKQTLFDCHRQFLHHDHVFRQNKSDFFKDRVEISDPILTP